MKNIVFYSQDFSLCFSLLMFLQDRYHVTTTTDIKTLKALIENSDFDLLLLDAEPSEEIAQLCAIVNRLFKKPVIITYVYTEKLTLIDEKIRQHVSSIFYKPFDLYEINTRLTEILV